MKNKFYFIVTVEMTPTTEVLEAKFEGMEKQLCELKEDVKSLGTSIAVNQKIIMDKFDSLDIKYATKSSVNRLRVIVWSVIGFFATAGGGLLLTKLLQ